MTRLSDFAPLPLLSDSSKNWTDLLLDTTDALATHCPMSMSEALAMPISFEQTYYQSSAWRNRKHTIEMQQEKDNLYFKLGNEIIKGLNNLGKRM